MDAPFYVVFAGVNGAGKSTLFQSGLWRNASMPRSLPRVNPDEILRELGGDWRSPADQREAGKVALERIERLFAARRSFNQETTLTGRLALRNVARAHALGYRVFVFYVGVADERVALRRIAHRVETGGHDVGADAVRRRFHASLRNFSLALDQCEQAIAFDNTREFASLAQWSHGTLAWWGNPQANGPWLLEAMRDADAWRSPATR